MIDLRRKTQNLYCPQVHKVIAGSLADRDGRIQKGDRVLSINGRSTKGVSHREALSILKVLCALACVGKTCSF